MAADPARPASARRLSGRLARTLRQAGSPVSLAAVMLALLSLPLGATPICRWVDGNGRQQITEVVPDRYKQLAVCIDSQKYELSPAQQRAAHQGLDEERARAVRDAAKPPIRPAEGSRRPADSTDRPAAKRPAEAVTDTTDCPTWWRLYAESADCFGPFQTTRGAVKAQAFDICNVVPSPEPKCGPRRQ